MNIIKQLLSPPRFSDGESTRAAQLLNIFLLVIVSILVILTLILLIGSSGRDANQSALMLHISLIILFGGAWILMRIGFAYIERSLAEYTSKLMQANQCLAIESAERQRSNELFHNLATNSHDFICIWDLNSHTWAYFNRPQFLDYPSPDILDHTVFLKRVHPDDYNHIHRQWLKVTENPNEHHLEFRLRAANGEWEWLDTRTRVLSRDGIGNPAQLVITINISTARKNHEELLWLAHERAEVATRSKTEFLANMSHEIRTPLNGVVAMTSLLQATNLDEEQRFYLNTIRHSSDALLTIINDILDLSKAESGRLGIEHLPLDLHRSIEEVLDILAPRAAEKDLELVYDIDRHVPATVLGDATRLRQVLINVLFNAIKFTRRGEIYVSIDAKPLHDKQVELHFAVRDTGIGIASEHLQHLFQPFSQEDTSNTRSYGGTGLGLAISKRLCELMGGSIWVESELEVGSTFHFTVITTIVETANDKAQNEIHPALARRAVLIVDDKAIVRQILKKNMNDWGMITTLMSSGAEALALMRDQIRFDIVVIDMQMPGMSGLTLAKELRKLVADLPIVMTSAFGAPMYATADSRYLHDLPIIVPPVPGAPDQREAVRQLGVKSILFKPVKPSALRAALLEHFEIAPAAKHVVEEPEEPRKITPSIDSDMGRRYPLRILMAEDNITNQKVTLRMLKRLGYDADIAVNGLEAVHALHRQTYDIILMDVQMPEMDGLEATRQIRVNVPTSDQPYIIAVTAAAMQLDREKCFAAGMDDFLAKPTRLEDLAQALKRFLPMSSLPVES